MKNVSIKLQKEKIETFEVLKGLAPHPDCGARVWFEGVVRNENEGKGLCAIDYECYEAMARKELATIGEEAKKEWGVHEVLVVHRIGMVGVGEVSLLVVTVAPHRDAAFAAAQYMIGELKKRVPIWKREVEKI